MRKLIKELFKMVRYYIGPQKKKNVFFRFRVNTILIALNILLFIIFSILIGVNQNILNFIALKPVNIVQGKYLWTLITSMFMHGGIFHLLVNMLSLFFVGTFIERLIGRRRYFWFYVLSGVFAGLFFVLLSLIFRSDFNAFAVGASGAIFGLIGLLMLITPNLPVYIMFIPIPIKMKYAAPGMLVVLWLVSVLANIPVGNTAHFGGLLAGIIYGIYLRKKYKRKIKLLNKQLFR